MALRHFKRTLMSALIAPALALPAAALADQQEQRDLRASQIIGMEVENRDGEDLGEVKDLVIDSRTGNIEYVALEHGGFLGMGEDLFAYPMSAFSIGEEGDELVLGVSEERLDDSEGFNDDNWPKVRDDRDYWASLDERFGISIGADEDVSASAGSSMETEKHFVRASELMGEEIVGAAGVDLGEIEDLLVSLDDGEVRYAVIDTTGDTLLVPLAMSEIDVRSDGAELALESRRDALDASQAFEKDAWPDLTIEADPAS